MKKVKVNYLNEDSETLLSETILECELPRIGEKIRYMRGYFEITDLERDFDNKCVNVLLTQK